MSEVCKNIDRLLKERGISGVKMSDDLGMSRSFMTELRKGRTKSIKIETAQKIADYFGVTTDYLFGKTNQSPLRLCVCVCVCFVLFCFVLFCFVLERVSCILG